MAQLNDTQINGNLNVTEDIQIGDISVTEKLDEINTNVNILSEKSVRIYSGENSDAGGVSWKKYTITFEQPFSVPPLVSIMPSTLFSMENIRLTSVTTEQLVYEVHTPTSTFTYGTKWMVIGY